ncbi:hypothetical protein FPV67DRAFT_1663871 [Lyophyllum atratum]|nr:hypothetical protein FPV67DRAFT_1663871 [Lyophyllum atratum]
MDSKRARIGRTSGLVVGGIDGDKEIKSGGTGKCRVAEVWSFTVVAESLIVFTLVWFSRLFVPNGKLKSVVDFLKKKCPGNVLAVLNDELKVNDLHSGPRGTTPRRELFSSRSTLSGGYKVPRRPFESARLDAELKLAGEYGLRNKREIWRIALTLSKIRRAARELLKLDVKDPKRLFEGNALIRRLVRIGVLDESRMRLDYVLALKVEDFLERRLQTQVFKSGLAKSIHHARVLIRQRHIRVGKQIVNVPSFVVRLDSQKHIDFALTSPYGGGGPGRVKRKRAAAAQKKEDGDDAEDDE